MSAISRFFGEGLRDAERRAAWFSKPRALDDTRVLKTIDGSVLVTVARRAIQAVGATAGSSVMAGAARRFLNHWQVAGWPEHRFSIGVVLLVGTAVHAGLTLLAPDPMWWMEWILPIIAAIAGLLFVAASRLDNLDRTL